MTGNSTLDSSSPRSLSSLSPTTLSVAETNPTNKHDLTSEQLPRRCPRLIYLILQTAPAFLAWTGLVHLTVRFLSTRWDITSSTSPTFLPVDKLVDPSTTRFFHGPPPSHQISDTASRTPPSCSRQLAFKTSSSKKRKILPRPPPKRRESSSSSSPDRALPSCEPDDDPNFSFNASGPDSPSFPRADSQQPASSLPQRLQTNVNGSLVSADYASSNGSSPASAYADLSIESDRGGDEGGFASTQRRGYSPLSVSKRAIMNGESNATHRSSSPLKRRASSMEPEAEDKTKGGSDSQATGSFPRAMSVDPPEYDASGSGKHANGDPPSFAEQIKTIQTLIEAAKQAPLTEGERAYVVSRTWVDKALALHPDAKKTKTEGVDVQSLGPVDNSDIIQETITDSSGTEITLLKAGFGLESFELFPEDAWNMVNDWYGVEDGQKPIVREAINQAPDVQSPPDIIYELHPPIFQIHRLWSEVSPLPIEQALKANNPPPLTLVRSRKCRAYDFLKEVKTLAGIPMETKVRLHSIPADKIRETQNQTREQPSEGSALTPPDSPQREGSSSTQGPWSHFLLDMPTFSRYRDFRMVLDMHDMTTNPNFNGKSPIQLHNLVTDQTLILDEQITNQKWVSNYSQADANRAVKGSGKGAMSGLSSKTNSGGSSPAPAGPLTRGKTQGRKYGRSIGAVGLHNLGNTCYMNSALQCVRSVEELTKYFLTDSYVDEINKGNPLGYNGRIALSYVGLLKEIYDEGRGSVSPRDFKSTVGRCRSTFQGWGQQDSQEFLGFLLDGLQEDLSRIKKKPYIEKPDSTDDMINDPEAIRKMAEQVWDITRKRDDSVIADLFTGMYKSTLKCPECGKISITFDPFNNLTLPLPVENLDRRTIKYFPLNDVPVKLEVELPKHSAMDVLRQFISVRTGVPPERLMGAEEYKERFFKIYDNDHDVTEEIGTSDVPTFHELEEAPTNWPRKRQRKVKSMLDVDTPADSSEWDDPAYERMAVPVFHRRPQAPRLHDTAPPSFIMLTKEEASNHDIIYRKVLQRLATFSTYQPLHADEQHDKHVDSDGVVVNPSDADSSGESKVAADSVEGEEDTVDITMKDANDKTMAGGPLPHEPTVLRDFNQKAPGFTDRNNFLDPQLQNLFELSYFYDSSESLVPTGWSQLDNNKMLPKVADRMPKSSVESDQGSPESWDSASANEESGKEESSPKAESDTVQTRMAEESSEEDPSPHFVRKPQSQKMNKKNKFRSSKMGKKAKRREKQMRAKEAHRAAIVKPQPMPPAHADGGPLIRLGEGLVVDWNEEAYEAVFGDNRRTCNILQILEDKALKISQRRRSARRTRGITLDECLDEFERAEVLSEQDMWYCPRCKEHRRASKKFDLWKSPDILVAHLKRFSSSGYRRDKLDVLVDFPITGLDLTERVIQKEDGKQEIYDLIGVDDHYGGLGGGHYTAYAKNFMDGRWYSYNDTSVSQVSDPSAAISSAAYLLFYRRRSSEPLGGPRFKEIFEKFDNPTVDDEESATEMGDDQSDDNFGGPGHRLSHHTTTTTIRPLVGSDDELPSYGHIQQSVEDEGLGMDEDPYQIMGSNPTRQNWSFNKSNNSPLIEPADSDTASDTAQVSQDERDDVEMKSIAPEHSDQESAAKYQRDSEEVAEIHVDGEKDFRKE